jgi:hypothetical protein
MITFLLLGAALIVIAVLGGFVYMNSQKGRPGVAADSRVTNPGAARGGGSGVD